MKSIVTKGAWVLGLPVRVALIALVRAYRAAIGPMMAGRCRFHPSCSAYAEEALRVHGALKGAALAGWRIVRCSPLSAGGLDPVPARGRWRGVYDGVSRRSD